MKIQELAACSLPLLAEGSDSTYPYWFGGTCFLCRFGGALYVVTARHCLRDKSKDEVRIQANPNSRALLPLCSLFTQSDSHRHEDEVSDDWAVFQVAGDGTAVDSMSTVRPLELDELACASWPPPEGHHLVVRGYPKTASEISYEECAIRWRAYMGSARYVCKPTWGDHVHTLRLDDVTEVESVDGLSGSPVFMVTGDDPPLSVVFAGLVLKGSKKSSLLHFLDARVVRAAVAKSHENRRTP